MVKNKSFTGQTAYCAIVDGAPACLIMADQFLLPSEVRQRYVQHTGFENRQVGVFCFGLNVLEMERDNSRDLSGETLYEIQDGQCTFRAIEAAESKEMAIAKHAHRMGTTSKILIDAGWRTKASIAER